MTLWARRSEANGDMIEFAGTSGSIEVKVTEHVAHARQFWGHLGRVLDEAEHKDAGTEESGE